MNTILTVLAVLALLVALLLIIALFVPNDYKVIRTKNIGRNTTQVYEYVKFLKNQLYYSKWVMMDPNLQKTYTGVDGQAGFIFAWTGNKKAGEGEQEIINLIPGKTVDVEIRFKKPFEGIAKAPMHFEAVSENETKISWQLSGRYKYPMNLMCLVTDKMLGNDIDESLENLKRILEK